MMMLTIVPLSLLLLTGSCSEVKFGYEEYNGPATWGEINSTCNGKHQSPINIVTTSVQEKKLPALQMKGNCELDMNMVNNGHTVMLTPEEPSNGLLTVFGGPLGNNIYIFAQLHFHWGKDNFEGSEHTIDNKLYSMEWHAVFYKKDYGSFNNAVNYDDGLTVLGYLSKVSSHTRCKSLETKIIQRIVDKLPEVKEPNGKKIKIKSFPLLKLLDPDDQCYYTYNGSLTTPPCSEVVTWIVFEQPKTVSDSQVSAFRSLESDDGDMTHNFRPVQPLGDRIVERGKSKSQSCPEQKKKC